MADSLHEEPQKDGFTHETPIRAFTTFSVDGLYAIGKGFRPSLQHLMPYLNAMEKKEGWRLVQILEAFTQTPSFVFRREPPVVYRSIREWGEIDRMRDPVMPELWIDPDKEEAAINAQERAGLLTPGEAMSRRIAAQGTPLKPIARETGTVTVEMNDIDPANIAKMWTGKADDPVNPKHYKGTGCAEIAENLPANLAHAITYIWRAGDKPDQPELQELDKSLWWMDREMNRARYFDAMDGEEDDDDCAPADMLAKGQGVFFDLRSYPIRHKKKPRVPVHEHGFYRFALERMEAAALCDWKASVVRAMVLYAIDRKAGALVSAINHTKQRRGSIHWIKPAELDRGWGLEP